MWIRIRVRSPVRPCIPSPPPCSPQRHRVHREDRWFLSVCLRVLCASVVKSTSSPYPNEDQLPRGNEAEECSDQGKADTQEHVERRPGPLAVLHQRDRLVAEGGERGVAVVEADREERAFRRRERRRVHVIAQDQAQQERKGEGDK